MVKTEYFCDWCQKNVTRIGAQFALNNISLKTTISVRNWDVCASCTKVFTDLVTARTTDAVDPVGEKVTGWTTRA